MILYLYPRTRFVLSGLISGDHGWHMYEEDIIKPYGLSLTSWGKWLDFHRLLDSRVFSLLLLSFEYCQSRNYHTSSYIVGLTYLSLARSNTGHKITLYINHKQLCRPRANDSILSVVIVRNSFNSFLSLIWSFSLVK